MERTARAHGACLRWWAQAAGAGVVVSAAEPFLSFPDPVAGVKMPFSSLLFPSSGRGAEPGPPCSAPGVALSSSTHDSFPCWGARLGNEQDLAGSGWVGASERHPASIGFEG